MQGRWWEVGRKSSCTEQTESIFSLHDRLQTGRPQETRLVHKEVTEGADKFLGEGKRSEFSFESQSDKTNQL